MLPSASYCRPWSSKAWESSCPITTPMAPGGTHGKRSPHSLSLIRGKHWKLNSPKFRLGGLAMLKKGACNIPAGNAIYVYTYWFGLILFAEYFRMPGNYLLIFEVKHISMLTNQLSNFSDLVVEGSVVGVDGRRCHAPPGDNHGWMMMVMMVVVVVVVMIIVVFFSVLCDGGRCRAPLGTVDRLWKLS